MTIIFFMIDLRFHVQMYDITKISVHRFQQIYALVDSIFTAHQVISS